MWYVFNLSCIACVCVCVCSLLHRLKAFDVYSFTWKINIIGVRMELGHRWKEWARNADARARHCDVYDSMTNTRYETNYLIWTTQKVIFLLQVNNKHGIYVWSLEAIIPSTFSARQRHLLFTFHSVSVRPVCICGGRGVGQEMRNKSIATEVNERHSP